MPTNYENARSTVLLATRCLCCNRPLRDAQSVEVGIGPVCRERYGFTQEISEEIRMTANQLIHEAALEGTTVARRLEIAGLIEEMGLTVLAAKIIERFSSGTVRITVEEMTTGRNVHLTKCFVLNTPYDGGRTRPFNDALKASVDWNQRSPVWKNENGRRVWGGWGVAMTPENKNAIWSLLRRHWSGFSISNPAGQSSIIPAL